MIERTLCSWLNMRKVIYFPSGSVNSDASPFSSSLQKSSEPLNSAEDQLRKNYDINLYNCDKGPHQSNSHWEVANGPSTDLLISLSLWSQGLCCVLSSVWCQHCSHMLTICMCILLHNPLSAWQCVKYNCVLPHETSTNLCSKLEVTEYNGVNRLWRTTTSHLFNSIYWTALWWKLILPFIYRLTLHCKHVLLCVCVCVPCVLIVLVHLCLKPLADIPPPAPGGGIHIVHHFGPVCVPP